MPCLVAIPGRPYSLLMGDGGGGGGFGRKRRGGETWGEGSRNCSQNAVYEKNKNKRKIY